MSRIVGLKGREVFDSRGNPTVEVDAHLSNGSFGSAIVPSGASVGSFEAVEKRDGDPKRFNGRGVLSAIANVNGMIAEALHGMDASNQAQVDARLIELDGTPNKANLGANAILGVSLAVLEAASHAKRLPLYQHVHELVDDGVMRMPVPMLNVLNGGAHANNDITFQEFMVIPARGDSFRDALRVGIEVFHALKQRLHDAQPRQSTAVGDEGGFAPALQSNDEALHVLEEAVGLAGYSLGSDCLLGLDCAATEYFDGTGYLEEVGKPPRSPEEYVDDLIALRTKHPHIISIEDGCDESRWGDWQSLTQQLAQSTQLVGDDIFVTNKDRLQQGIQHGIANSILVKLNQVGTVTETLEVIKIAQGAGYSTVVSHRSGDTEDTKVADIAVGAAAGQIKTGSASRSERVAKYNRLLRIEEQFDGVPYHGRSEFERFAQQA
ncbi:MAG: phosphopyruvate hydratase [Gammaproteobacteria bacterium]|nr:phosphopyruvate hydratase [Gammaproteobacteria bacterium]